MISYEEHEYEVLVVGAGGAGLRAAIEASDAGASVGVVCKSVTGRNNTVRAHGGIAAAFSDENVKDVWGAHFADTMRSGQFINNCAMVELHAREAPERFRELESWGAIFDRNNEGVISRRHYGGHKFPRLAHIGNKTGLAILQTLKEYTARRGIPVHSKCRILTLLKDEGRIVGALGYDGEKDQFKLFHSNAVIVAAGGVGGLYPVSSNTPDSTGDGISLAFHAMADLIDMEFIQFHPTGIAWPEKARGFLVSEGVRSNGGVLTNINGHRFMFDNVPVQWKNHTAADEEEGWRHISGSPGARMPPELLTRDHVTRSIFREIKEGRGGLHEGVFLDVSCIKDKLPDIAESIAGKLAGFRHEMLRVANVDITRVPIEVRPVAHYVMGGIRVDPVSQMSSVPGLFATGECAAGLHGANRLGGNSLSELLVFGKRAGEYAAEFARRNPTGRIDNTQVEEASRQVLRFFHKNGCFSEEHLVSLRSDLQLIMQDLVGIVRKEEELVSAKDEILKLRKRFNRVFVNGERRKNRYWQIALDLHSLFTVAETILLSALERKESRGSHYREDFPNTEDHYGKSNIVVCKGYGGEVQVEVVRFPEIPSRSKRLID